MKSSLAFAGLFSLAIATPLAKRALPVYVGLTAVSADSSINGRTVATLESSTPDGHGLAMILDARGHTVRNVQGYFEGGSFFTISPSFTGSDSEATLIDLGAGKNGGKTPQLATPLIGNFALQDPVSNRFTLTKDPKSDNNTYLGNTNEDGKVGSFISCSKTLIGENQPELFDQLFLDFSGSTTVMAGCKGLDIKVDLL